MDFFGFFFVVLLNSPWYETPKKSIKNQNQVSSYFFLGLRQMHFTFINTKNSQRPLPHTGTYPVCKEPANAQQRHRRRPQTGR
jgi:hypothetical protein